MKPGETGLFSFPGRHFCYEEFESRYPVPGSAACVLCSVFLSEWRSGINCHGAVNPFKSSWTVSRKTRGTIYPLFKLHSRAFGTSMICSVKPHMNIRLVRTTSPSRRHRSRMPTSFPRQHLPSGHADRERSVDDQARKTNPHSIVIVIGADLTTSAINKPCASGNPTSSWT